MPYVDTTPASFAIKLTENDYQEKFADLLTQYGWTGGTGSSSVALKFLKVTKFSGTDNLTNSSISLANHYIFKNPSGKMFGMAVVADNVYYDPTSVSQMTPTDRTNFYKTTFAENKSNTVFYYYMLEKLPTKITDDSVVVLAVNSDLSLLTAALDIEVTSVNYTNGITVFIKEGSEPDVMQSPIVKSVIRSTILETVHYPLVQTNWWSDSEIRVQGLIDEDNIFIVIQADNVPAWEGNIVPTVPFYFGKLDSIDVGDDAVAMFTGTVPELSVDGIAKYDFNDFTKKAGAQIIPLLKSYPNHPSNGVDSVMVSRSKFGSRYQEYFLSWNTPSNDMPPDRENADGNQYPRAWNNVENNEFKYQFNPSRYSGKVHTSKVYAVHPEEGVRGSLTKAIGLSALNFNAGKLRIRKQNCPEKLYDVYRFFMVGAVSPLTKRPATPYRPMGLGIYDSEYNPNA